MTEHFLDETSILLLKPVNEEVYCCHLCPQIFRYKKGLIMHEELGVHYGGKKLKCGFTEHTYQGSNFAAHQKENHYHCKSCDNDTVYCTRFDLNNHYFKEHPFHCTVCKKQTISLFSLRRHTQLIHASKCKKTRDDFQSETEFIQHQEQRHYF